MRLRIVFAESSPRDLHRPLSVQSRDQQDTEGFPSGSLYETANRSG